MFSNFILLTKCWEYLECFFMSSLLFSDCYCCFLWNSYLSFDNSHYQRMWPTDCELFLHKHTVSSEILKWWRCSPNLTCPVIIAVMLFDNLRLVCCLLQLWKNTTPWYCLSCFCHSSSKAFEDCSRRLCLANTSRSGQPVVCLASLSTNSSLQFIRGL